MKKILILATALLGCISLLHSQNIAVKWSEKLEYDNKTDGFFDYFIGTNESYIYAKFNNMALNPKKANKKIKVIAFDKNTMKKTGEANLIGYGNDKSKAGMDYYQTILLDKVIYVLWTKVSKGKMELYAESFDDRLKRVNQLKKIYEINIHKKGTDNLVVDFNRNSGNKILLGKEIVPQNDGENLRFEYRLLNEDFSLSESQQVTLPIQILKKRRTDGSFNNAVCDYELAIDGNIYAQNVVRMTPEEKKNLKKGEASVYPVIMQINPQSGTVKEYKLKFSKKNTFNFHSLITKNGIKLYGFFSDLDKDVQGHDTHGTFFISLDNKDFINQATKFSYFDKRFLDELFAADKENQKKARGMFKNKKAKESDAESLSDNYTIESVLDDGKDIILFCSIMNNWSRTVCTTNSNGGTTCQTYYYCTKNNVTAFKLNSAGDIIMAKNLDRSITYNRWNVNDVSVMEHGGNYYVVYGSSFQITSQKKNNSSKKSKKQMHDRLEYAILNGKTGEFKKNEYQVNKLGTKKNDQKFVDASNVYQFDNKLYVNCTNTKIKPTTWISCLCPPVFYALYFSGNSRKGTGYLGNITPLN